MAPAAAGTAQPTNDGISAGRRVANARPAEESVDNLLGCLAVESDPSSPGLAGELRRPCTPSKLRRTTAETSSTIAKKERPLASAVPGSCRKPWRPPAARARSFDDGSSDLIARAEMTIKKQASTPAARPSPSSVQERALSRNSSSVL